MIHKCLTHASIVSVLHKEWNVSKRQVRNYIKKTYARWEEEAKEDSINRSEMRRNQFEGLLEAAMKQTPPDFKAASTILDKLCRIDGAYSAEKVDITGNINVEESHKRIADMLTGIAAEREAGSVSKKPN